MIGLDQRATVYTADGSGDYTVTAKSNLPCRLIVQGVRSAEAPADERADPARNTFLMWGPDYTMPSNAQVAIDGQRYNVQPHTVAKPRNALSAVEYQRAMVEVAL